MKIKDLEKTVNVAWSPASQHPILLATGTAAQQLDASFSTNACLELYSLNLSDPGMDMELKSSTLCDNRFYKVVWGSYGIGGEQGSGVIVGGCDGGLVQIYSASKLLAGEECLISRQDKHNGPVQSLDFNPFQSNLLASGAADSEIYIWDLNNTSTPMAPGSKSQPFENVQSLSWNRQVQHILATTFHTRCVVWDLRKNEPIIKLTDSSSHIRWKSVTWHPEVATQLCLASEEDQAPVIQLWDLRFATSPLKVLDNHQRGVLSVAWCIQDSDLLISCGKDNRILCWNPNSNAPRGEVLSEIAHTLQWNFDVAWCPRNPALIAASSFDGHVSIYSLMGGKQQQVQTSNKIADSFPGMDGYIQAPVPQQAPPVSVDLAIAPKWLKRPVGASFGFGGKLITFENNKPTAAQIQQAAQPSQVPPLINRSVLISQVITEPELIKNSNDLEQALQLGNFAEYCRLKAESLDSQHDKYVWHFLKANFDPNPKLELLNLLGFQPDEINEKLNEFLKKSSPETSNDSIHSLTNQLATLNRCDSESDPDLPSDYGADLLTDDFNASSTFDAIAADNKIANEPKKIIPPFKIKTGNDTDGMIAQALLLGNIEVAVELCLEANRMADALIIAITGGPELLARTQYRYLEQSEGYVSALISALVSEDWSAVINQCNVESWKEALAAALTYSTSEELPGLCERLGERLESENKGNRKLLQDAQLCYICAGSFNKLVATWTAEASSRSPQKLQELVELVTFMQKAIEQQGRNVEVSGNLADLLSQYAVLLASQGSLNNALNYLGSSTDQNLSELRERLYCSLGHKPAYNKPQQQQQQPHRLSNARQSIPNYTNQQNQFTQQQNMYNQKYNSFNSGVPNTPTPQQPQQQQQQPWQKQNSIQQNSFGGNQQPPKQFTPAPTAPPTHPPRPTSVGSAHSASGISGRSKYVVDPSVQSNMPSYNNMRTPYNAPMPNQAAMPVNQMMPGQQMSQSNPLAPNVMAPPIPLIPTSPISSLASSNNQQNTPFAYSQSNTSMPAIQKPNIMTPAPLNQSYNSPIQTQPPLQSTMPGSFPNQSSNNLYNPGNVEVAQPAINALQAQQMHLPSPPGWNDPPVVNKSNRPNYNEHTKMSAEHAGTRLWKTKVSHSHEPKQEFAAQAPITHPLYGSAPEMTPVNNGYGEPPAGIYGQAPPPTMQQQQNMQQQNMQQQHMQQQNLQQQGNRFPPAQQFHQQQQQQHQPKPAPTPEPPKQKGPVPEEHMYLQTVFDELKEQCTCAANNPQTKRKLDDVSRKLETLYDMLREHKLSPTTLAVLHQMVQMVQIGNYTGGLGLHTQLVSGPDFSQIASFMPGLKVLLQCALQLQVFLR